VKFSTLIRLLGVVFPGFAALLFQAPARAGDFAERYILGFSPGGRSFAFEQYGIQDGTGFPYADIFLIDTQTGQWVAGSPFRVLLKDERAQLKWARRDAVTKAGNALRERLISVPGRILASNPPQELSADPHAVTARVP
jgi:predicted secreted protein